MPRPHESPHALRAEPKPPRAAGAQLRPVQEASAAASLDEGRGGAPERDPQQLLRLLHARSGLHYAALGASLSRRGPHSASRAPITRMRLSDWATGRRAMPDWVLRAAAAELCELWAAERAPLAEHAQALLECDARWAGALDPALGAFVECEQELPLLQRPRLARLKAALLEAFVRRYGCSPPL